MSERKYTEKIKIDYANSERLKQIALKNLGIDNMNQLRDRFEGQSYLNNFLVRSYFEIAFEKYTNNLFVDKQKKEATKNYLPSITLNKKTIKLFAFQNEELPKISISEFDYGVFGVVNLDSRVVEILGFLDYKSIVNLADKENLSPIIYKGYHGIFKKLDHLLPINELPLD